MKQVFLLALMITLVLLVAACGGTAEKIERIGEEFAEADEIVLNADITADYGDKVFEFKITCTKTEDETAVEIKEPETLRGIRAVSTDESYELQYDGTVMTTGTMTQNGLSPSNALLFLLEQWQTGFVTGAVRERYGEIYTIAAETKVSDSISQRTWFDEEKLLPVRSEIWENGTAVIICEFDNVILE